MNKIIFDVQSSEENLQDARKRLEEAELAVQKENMRKAQIEREEKETRQYREQMTRDHNDAVSIVQGNINTYLPGEQTIETLTTMIAILLYMMERKSFDMRILRELLIALNYK